MRSLSVRGFKLWGYIPSGAEVGRVILSGDFRRDPSAIRIAAFRVSPDTDVSLPGAFCIMDDQVWIKEYPKTIEADVEFFVRKIKKLRRPKEKK